MAPAQKTSSACPESGWPFVESIEVKFHCLPILAVSALPRTAVAPSAHAAGCDRFLAKPFDVDDLLGAVRELLTETEAART